MNSAVLKQPTLARGFFQSSASHTHVRRGLAVFAAALSLLIACSPGPAPSSQSPKDPSSAAAPEGMSPALAVAGTTPPPAAAEPIVVAPTQPAASEHDHQHHGHSHPATAKALPPTQPSAAASQAPVAAGAAVYVCPMHPEVTSPEPGVCPECNMKLVLKK